jgi:hypothetical protein
MIKAGNDAIFKNKNLCNIRPTYRIVILLQY